MRVRTTRASAQALGLGGLGDAWAGTPEGQLVVDEPAQQVVITGQRPSIDWSKWLPLVLVVLAVVLIARATDSKE